MRSWSPTTRNGQASRRPASLWSSTSGNPNTRLRWPVRRAAGACLNSSESACGNAGSQCVAAVRTKSFSMVLDGELVSMRNLLFTPRDNPYASGASGADSTEASDADGRSIQVPMSQPITDMTPCDDAERKRIMSPAGMVGWLSATGRPELRVYHSCVACYMANLAKGALKAVIRIVRYADLHFGATPGCRSLLLLALIVTRR